MKNITMTNMKLIDGEFSQKMINRHTSLRLSTTDLAPVTLAKRIVLRRRWLELIYAIPNRVLRREILRSVSMTQNIPTSSANPIWNILVRLDRIFPYARSIQKPAVAGMEKELIFSQNVVSVKWRGLPSDIQGGDVAYRPCWQSEREVLQKGQRTVSHFKPALMETVRIVTERALASTSAQPYGGVITHLSGYHSFKPALLLSRTADSESAAIKSEVATKPPATGVVTHLSGYHSFKPVLAVSRKTIHDKQTNIAYPESASIKSEVVTQSPETGVVTHLSGYHSFKPVLAVSRKTVHDKQTNIVYPESSPILPSQPVNRESTATNNELPAVTTPLPTIIHKPPGVNIAKNPAQEIHSTHCYFNFMNNDRMHTNTRWTETARIYHTQPEIEYVTSTRTEVVKETVIEREIDSRPPPEDAIPKSAAVDMNRLVDQVCSHIERKLVIEKERRGLYG